MVRKILMMGGRRAGKSTILSSILTQLRENTPGTICTIIDKTDYTQQIVTKSGVEPLPTLDIKQREIANYMKKRQMNTEFLVDMSPTYGQVSYILEVSTDNSTVDFEFIDVPGEWMRANIPDHAKLVSLVETTDVFVIVIDTPFLMNTDNDEGVSINLVYNRVNEITQAMAKMKIENDSDFKQIILCPVKCEKWMREGNEDLVVEKVKNSYRDLINRWVTSPEVTIQIMPIQTVGGIESTRLLPAKLYFKNDNDNTGESCSIDPITNTLINKEGILIRQTVDSFVEDDNFWTIDYTDIPLSWYRLNGEGVKPKFCEQPGYHILKFLVEKEEHAVKRLENLEKRPKSLLERIMTVFLKMLIGKGFDEKLPNWEKVVSQLNSGGYVKTCGDGFCYLHEKID